MTPTPCILSFRVVLIGLLSTLSSICSSMAASAPLTPVIYRPPLVTNPPAAPTTLSVKVDSKSRTASLSVPTNVNSVLIQSRLHTSKSWVNFKTLSVKAAPASLRVTLPKDYAKSSWRATGSKVAIAATKQKYPSKFFAGKKTFGETLASSLQLVAMQRQLHPLQTLLKSLIFGKRTVPRFTSSTSYVDFRFLI